MYTDNDEIIDYKIVKKIYPRHNNSDVLEFIIDRDPNLFLRKNKLLICGAIEVDSGYIIENGFASKLFSMLTIELASQTITRNNNRYLYI